MNYCELTYLISTIACAIAENVNEEDLNVLAAAFSQLGDTLALLALTK